MDRSIAGAARRSILALVLAMSAGACNPAPPTPTPGATPGPVTSGPPAAQTSLADALRDAIDPAAIEADLRHLQELTDAAGGTRPAGSDAHAAAAIFVADELRAAGFTVDMPPIELPYFEQTAPTILEVVGGDQAFEDAKDLRAMLFSPSGDVSGPLVTLGFDPGATTEFPTGLGCQAAEWAGIQPSSIVLVQPAPCRRREVVLRAQAAGVAALVTAYPGWLRDRVLRPTLLDPAELAIPVVGVTHDVGLALAAAADSGATAHVAVHTTVETRSSPNVIAESPGGDPEHVLMIGGHLDSVLDGAGMNDNGSGTMAILEIARRLAAVPGGPGAAGGGGWKVRVAFWTGEELGLFGSTAYVAQLGSGADAIEAYLNFDMLGSRNGVRLVYDGVETSRPRDATTIATMLASAMDAAGLASETVPLSGASDHGPFDAAGITVGGLFSGANEVKTPDQAARFGGTANEPNDACYHLGCDTVDNVDLEWLEGLTRAAAWVVGALASGEVTLTGA